MTGSGSTVVALARDETHAAELASRFEHATSSTGPSTVGG
jgi:hypothetical protein